MVERKRRDAGTSRPRRLRQPRPPICARACAGIAALVLKSTAVATHTSILHPAGEKMAIHSRPKSPTASRSKPARAMSACGRSRSQPFCDGTHKGFGLRPRPSSPRRPEQLGSAAARRAATSRSATERTKDLSRRPHDAAWLVLLLTIVRSSRPAQPVERRRTEPAVRDHTDRRAAAAGQDLARQASERFWRSIEMLGRELPRYGLPYVDGQGDIVIPRRGGAVPRGTPIPAPAPGRPDLCRLTGRGLHRTNVR